MTIIAPYQIHGPSISISMCQYPGYILSISCQVIAIPVFRLHFPPMGQPKNMGQLNLPSFVQ